MFFVLLNLVEFWFIVLSLVCWCVCIDGVDVGSVLGVDWLG